ncbi:MAG: hypothetical protein MI749_11325 [Desulfovibrionales bacterium]|nr:hypothetical protein [Desulfovibrionales bacterium]
MKIREFFHGLGRSFRGYWDAADEVARNRAVETIEAEVEELDYIFALVSQGYLAGLPAPPAQISMELLPLMEGELTLMIDRLDTAQQPLSRLFSVFDVG